MEYAWVGIGGSAGAMARYAVSRWFERHVGTAFPYGTFVVNISGAFLIGVLMSYFLEHMSLDPRWRLLLVIGFLGGYTTFSSYAYEVYALADRGQWGRASVYALGSNVLGLIACVVGIVLARRLSSG